MFSDRKDIKGDDVCAYTNGLNNETFDQQGNQLEFAWDISDRVTFKYLFGYNELLYERITDDDNSASLVNDRQFYVNHEAEYVSHELQLFYDVGDSVTFTIVVANAGPDQSVEIDEFVQLNGSQSSDFDGDPLQSDWALMQLPAGSGAVLSDENTFEPSFVPDLAGLYVLRLIVNDGTESSFPDSVVIIACDGDGNTPPVADAGPDQLAAAGDLVQLDGSGSADVDGDPLAMSWSFIGMPRNSP